jgi:predicted lipid-binding transport protein (Tim44 family)
LTLTIIILAMIAAFLGLRLYTLLGKRTGHEQTPVLPQREDRPRTAPVLGAPIPSETAAAQDASSSDRLAPGMVYEPQAEIGIRAILAADRSFDVARFIGGAQSAYRMILEAFWAGDREALADLCDADSYEAMDVAISEREARGETLQNRLVSIERAVITSADLTGKDARVAVRFTADIAAVTRDSGGAVIAGSMSDATTTNDVWGFRRDIGSANPNWLLDETDADAN